MQLFTLGLNHQTAPLAIRERVAFHAERLRSALAELTLREPVREAAILSTCNRTEIYCALGEPQAAFEWLAGYHRVQPQELKAYLYTLPHGEAVRHAFRVASGLDSMVVGEPQILGQMKEAVRVAESAGTLGTLLNKLFQRSFAVAKEVRSNTGIGANVVSMAAAAVRLAGRIVPSLADEEVLRIGEARKYPACEPPRCGGHRDDVGADSGVAAYLLRHRERALEEFVEERSECAGGLGDAGRLLHLAQDLRFADHHGVEAGGDAERVPHGFAMREGVEIGLELL